MCLKFVWVLFLFFSKPYIYKENKSKERGVLQNKLQSQDLERDMWEALTKFKHWAISLTSASHDGVVFTGGLTTFVMDHSGDRKRWQ